MVGFTSGAYRSTDGGVSWQHWNVPNTTINDLAVANTEPRRIWAATNIGTWFTDDGGATWLRSRNEYAQEVTVDPTNPTVVYVGTTGAVRRTQDNGTTLEHSGSRSDRRHPVHRGRSCGFESFDTGATSASGGTSTCVTSGSTVACQLPQLGSGGSVTLTIVISASSAPGSFTHMATVTASGMDVRGANNVVSAVTTVSNVSQGGGSSGGGGGSTSPFMLAALMLLSCMRAAANKFGRSAR